MTHRTGTLVGRRLWGELSAQRGKVRWDRCPGRGVWPLLFAFSVGFANAPPSIWGSVVRGCGRESIIVAFLSIRRYCVARPGSPETQDQVR